MHCCANICTAGRAPAGHGKPAGAEGSCRFFKSFMHFAFGALRRFAVGKVIADRTQRQRREHIEDRVLLHKDGGNADEKGGDGRGDAPAPGREDRRVPEGEERRERADDMQ